MIKSAFEILPPANEIPKPQRGIFKKRNQGDKADSDPQKDYYPYDLDLFLGRECNLNCIYCFSQVAENKREKNLTEVQYKDIINQAFDLGVKMVIIVGRGEPFLSPILWNLLKYIDNKSGHTVIVSNATLISSKVARRLYHFNCSVVAKLNSFNPVIQDRLAGVPGAAEKMYRGIFNLIEAGFNKGKEFGQTRLIVNNLLCRLNYEEVPEIIKWSASHNIRPFIELIQWAGRAVENIKELQLTKRQFSEFEKTLEQLIHKGWSWVGFPYLDGEVCQMDRMPLYVTEKGYVIPCWMREDLAVGNVKESPVKDLWLKPELVKMRREHRRLKNLIVKGIVCGECSGRKHRKAILEKHGIKIKKMSRFG